MLLRTLPLLFLLIAPAAWAQSDEDGRERPRPAERAEAPRGMTPLAETVRRVERHTRGQILSAERVPFDGRALNRVKLVDSTGRVRVITEDPMPRERRRAPERDDD